MSSEHIVNRVSQPNQAQDGAPQTAAAQRVASVGNPEGVGVKAGELAEAQAFEVIDWSMSPAAVVAGHAVESPDTIYSPEAELASDYLTAKAELEKSAPLIAEVLQNKFLARDPDLAGLKKQVIAAFKHLGLDTRQFFGT